METNMESKDIQDTQNIQIESSWKDVLSLEFDKEYFKDLWRFVRDQYLAAEQTNKTVYPKSEDIFRAFDLCPFDQVKVVILGQDPYHGESQDAH